ncbi:hypothetical protein ACIPW5_10315 [Streptomyces sp. NPDC090077]|uniref:hypothetical protein n=1 Tax=Streptomyces sp. NPDC090077 TaxID=3365938 RepID=UPI0037F46893
MHRLATLSRTERHRLVSGFIDETLEGLDTDPEFVALMRSVMPELPDDPGPEQVEAWVELAGLCQSPDFRAAIRRTAQDQAQEPCAERYRGLLATVDGWPGSPALAPVRPWFTTAFAGTGAGTGSGV